MEPDEFVARAKELDRIYLEADKARREWLHHSGGALEKFRLKRRYKWLVRLYEEFRDGSETGISDQGRPSEHYSQ